MLERLIHPNGVVTYQSPLLRTAGVVHGFSTRIGGVSGGVFASLNLGNPAEAEKDSDDNIRENFQRLQEAIGCPPNTLRAWVKQVHGRNVELLEREPEGEYAETLGAEVRDRFSGQVSADGIVSVVPGVLLTIRVADCVPVLLASEDGKIVGAAHAGWRGVAVNVVDRTIRAMRECGAREIFAAIGPSISVSHFEVGEEVADEFAKKDLGAAIVGGVNGAKHRVDLMVAVGLQVAKAGVKRAENHDRCTFRDAQEFFSHRRDHGKTGRMAAVIMARQ